ncbi:hypothetical protein ACHAPT_000794 [Fusarium lateritium]
MSGSIDYAFSTYGWAYRTGRQDRKHNQIIRTHRTTEDNKNAASTLLIEFELREAQIWTKKDLQVTDVYQEELALVVGELLPAEYCDPTGKDMQSAKYPRAFDPNVHDSVDPAPTTGIVVKQINHGGCSLFLVHGREGGLYRKSWLPSEALARVVYYREWTEKTSRTQEKQRSTDFKAGICKYSKEYIEKHQDNFLDPLQSSALKGQPDALLLVPPRQMVISYARQAVALWKEQGETGHLAQVYDVIMSSLGRINWEELEETDDEDHSKLIRVMIEGNDEFDMQEAIEAFQACQKPRTNGPPTDPRFMARMVHMKESQLRNYKEVMAAERRAVRELGGEMPEVVAPQKLVQEIMSTMDVHHCRNLMIQLFQMAYMRHDLFAQAVVKDIANEARMLKACYRALSDEDGEDDGDGEVEDDDEGMPDASEMEEDA